MGKKQNSKFPAAKIKKIIQQNQDIGKLCNSIPPIIEKSLELFLDDICDKLNTIITEYDLNKLTLPALKKAIEDSKYDFMKDMFEEVESLEKNKNKRPRKKVQDEEEYQKNKGRKVTKIDNPKSIQISDS